MIFRKHPVTHGANYREKNKLNGVIDLIKYLSQTYHEDLTSHTGKDEIFLYKCHRHADCHVLMLNFPQLLKLLYADFRSSSIFVMLWLWMNWCDRRLGLDFHVIYSSIYRIQ